MQGVPRDDETQLHTESALTKVLETFRNNSGNTGGTRGSHGDSMSVEDRLDEFMRQLKQLSSLCKTRNAFTKTDKRMDIDIPASIVKGCNDTFDEELFRCQVLDWFDMVQQQQQTQQKQKQNQPPSNEDGTGDNDFDDDGDVMRLDQLAEQIRRAEMEMSIAAAPDKSLEVVRKRLEMIATDRQKRFDVLKELVEEICAREMNLYIQLIAPDSNQTLTLTETSATGFLSIPMEMANEPLPVA